MTQQESIWNDFNLEKNCVQITDTNAVRLYFAQFTLALRCLERILVTETGPTNAESLAVNSCVERLAATFRLLGLRYFYDRPGENLKLDATDSGFFHFSTILALEADLRARDRILSELPTVQQLKERMAERIIRFRAAPRDLQEQISRRLHFEGLTESSVFRAFSPGELTQVGDPGSAPTYFWSFATYDRSLNRPFLYMVYFTARAGLSRTTDTFGVLCSQAERLASGKLNLLAFARMLGDAVEGISLRIVKRLILGPYWSPHFTENEGDLGKVLADLKERFPFALRWETETLISDREQVVGGGLLSRGKLRQIFWIPKDLDLATRGVSHLERFILLPHWLAQHVAAADVLRDHQRYVIDKEDEIYGIH